MTTMALYKALLEANVSEDLATKAVEGLILPADVATKSDLKDLVTKSELKVAMKDLVTKSELKVAMKDLVTKSELKVAMKDLVTKSELKVELKELELKFDLKLESSLSRLETRLTRRIFAGNIITIGIMIALLELI